MGEDFEFFKEQNEYQEEQMNIGESYNNDVESECGSFVSCCSSLNSDSWFHSFEDISFGADSIFDEIDNSGNTSSSEMKDAIFKNECWTLIFCDENESKLLEKNQDPTIED